MIIYIIDTCRTEDWRKAFLTDGATEIVFAHQHDCRIPPEFASDDLVFAHTHVNVSGPNPDFPLTNWKNPYPDSLKIQGFVECLRNCPADSKPLITLYSGADKNPATKNEWRLAAIDKGGPLEAYPLELVRFHPNIVNRFCGADFLKAVVDQAIPLIGGGSGGYIPLGTAWIDEAKLAARLLVEAAELDTEECNGITVVKPPNDLAKMATDFIDASKNGTNLSPSAKALCDRLDQLKPN
jgi:hypothetical protein